MLPHPVSPSDKPGHITERSRSGLAGEQVPASGGSAGAADALVDAVLGVLHDVTMGESAGGPVLGVGLFAGQLGDRVGPLGSVVAVESSAGAVRDARRSLHDLPQVRLVHTRVDRWLSSTAAPAPSQRRRAGPAAIRRRTAGRRRRRQPDPRVIAYVACDPAALGRDYLCLRAAGYEVASLRAFDLFPMTHHIECVAAYTPAPGYLDVKILWEAAGWALRRPD